MSPAEHDDSLDPETPAEAVFAEHWAQAGSDATLDLSALCAEHPELADELRALHARVAGARQALDEVANAAAPAGDARDEHEAAILTRLAGRARAVDRYQLGPEVARGGMGTILRVRDLDLERDLAMKVLRGVDARGSSAGASASRSLGRFLDEAQVTGQLDHPGIVPVHELGLDAGGRVFFTMKLVHGRTLGEVFDLAREEADGWNETRAVGVVLKVCEAMAYAHDKQVVHRDLKPSNVMVGRFGEVYVMDWGLAKVLGTERGDSAPDASAILSAREALREDDSQSPWVTSEGEVIGTPAYMSPEQARGSLGEVGAASDVYAVGTILYTLLAGHAPYLHGKRAPGARAVWRAVLAGPPPDLLQLVPRATPELVAIARKAMAREPEQRYASMVLLARDLRDWLEGRVVRAYEGGAVAELKKWVGRNRPLAGALAAAALLLVLGFAVSSFFFLRERDSRAREQESAALARERTDEVFRLADLERIAVARRQAEQLWPLDPGLVDDWRAWVTSAEELVARRAVHEATLAEVRARAEPVQPAALEAWRAQHPLAAERAARAADLASVEGELSSGTAETQIASDPERLAVRNAFLERERERLQRELEDLDSRLELLAPVTFAADEDAWWHSALVELVAAIDDLRDPVRGLIDGRSVPRDLGVRRRLQRIEALQERAAGDDSRARWARLAAELAADGSPYGDLELAPSFDLLPLGTDPDSGLQEFAHLPSGEPAVRDGRSGNLVLEPATGVVLVLLPGGSFRMGAQRVAGEPNFDPLAQGGESPTRDVALDPFFVSKYELTQGQWLAFTGENPALYAPSHPAFSFHDLTHPVEMISWYDAQRVLGRLGLALPTEAQWEYAARAGTDTPWWTGAERDSLVGAVNLADESARRAQVGWTQIDDWPGHDDGWIVHAPVDSFVPNWFGLHGVVGNVDEWVRDAPARYDVPPDPGDGFRSGGPAGNRVNRGGAFDDTPFDCRVAMRQTRPPEGVSPRAGVRPVRVLRREPVQEHAQR